jgi:CRISPR-associated protein Csm2
MGNDYHNSTVLDTSEISFTNIQSELFSEIAKKTAIKIAEDKKANKPTQIRKFFDEIVMWEIKVSLHKDKFKDYLPYIMMLNAKAAYAKGRNLIDANFIKLLNDCLSQVKDPETMRIFKLFMEAFMGFYKQFGPKN